MHVEDPNTPSDTDDVLAAMDAGIAAAATEAPTAPVEAPAEPEPEAPAADDAAPEAAAAEPVTSEEPAQPEPEAAEPDAVEAEIASMGLKEKSAERFRELAADREAMAPLREAMKEVGIDDPKVAAQALARVRDADYMISRVVETQANAEQFDKTLSYLALVNKPGDMQALEQAWDMILPEIELLAKALGKEIPGMVDPLADHADLRNDVELGDMTRARALEVARLRNRESLLAAGRKADDESAERQQADTRAKDEGRTALNELGAELQAADPVRYAALAPVLVAKVRDITAQFPPSEWASRAARVYATLPMPAATSVVKDAPRPAVGHVPLRPSGGRPDVSPSTFDDPMDALDFGVQQASR